MQKVKNLGDLRVDILPPKVVMLLSKYAYRLRKTSDITIKMSSKTVFKELEEINSEVDDEVLEEIYQQIEAELSPLLKKKLTIDTVLGFGSDRGNL